MANWSTLKAAIASIIKTNGNKEITGQLLQNVLNNIVSSVGENSTFAGIATPTTNPGAPDGNIFYLATEVGTYSNFNGIEIASEEAVILEWRGSWVKKTTGFATKEKLTELKSGTLFNFNINKKYIPIIKGYTPFPSGEKIGTIGAHSDFSCTPLIYVKSGDILRVSGATIFKCYYWSSFEINKDTYIEGKNTTLAPENAVVACIAFSNASNSTYENLKISIPNEIIIDKDLINKSIAIETLRYEDYEVGKEYIIQDGVVVSSNNSAKKCKEILCSNAIGFSVSAKINFAYINFIFCDIADNILWQTSQNMGDMLEANTILYFPPNAYKMYITATSTSVIDIEVLYKRKYNPLMDTPLYYDINNIKKGNFFFTSVGSNPISSYNDSFGYWLIAVQEGDTLILNIKGGNNARAYVTLDSNFKVIRQANASLNLIGTNSPLLVKTNEKYVIIQTSISSDLYDKVNVTLLKKSLLSNLNPQDKINILSISNSYGCDGLAFVPSILKSIGVNNVECAIAYHAAANLQGHIENAGTNWYKYYYTIEGVWKQESSKNLEYILNSKKWDYIVFQQGSADSGKYSTYQPYLENLIEYVFDKISYPVICAFNITQPYANGYAGLSGYENSQEQMYNGILEAAKKVKEEYGINTLINVAKAVQLARSTDLNQYGDYSEGQLSCDGTHLDGGIGRLLAGYTWILSLLRNRLNTDIYSSNFLPSKSQGLFLPDDNRGKWINVTKDMAYIAKKCATNSLVE